MKGIGISLASSKKVLHLTVNEKGVGPNPTSPAIQTCSHQVKAQHRDRKNKSIF